MSNCWKPAICTCKRPHSLVSRCPSRKRLRCRQHSASAAVPQNPRSDKVFLGTSVVSGTATALVLKTGAGTDFGDITARLSARPPETEFDRGTRRFGFLILQTVFFLVLFVTVVSVVRHRPPLESVMFGVALAVGLTPEFLPMIVAVTLSQGAVHMAQKKSSSSIWRRCRISAALTFCAATRQGP